MEIIKVKEYKEPYESLYKLNVGLSLDEYEAEEAMKIILNEKDESKRIGLLTMLLNGIMVKGSTVNEVSGLLNAALGMDNTLDANKPKINLPNNNKLVGVASSGKKGIKTINITTTACFVAAACGANIAKACSHSTSSKTGSLDFLDICKIDVDLPFNKKVEILKKYHISFFSIEETTPKFAEVYGGVFYAPHAMSFALAGLSFPIQIDSLAYGLSHPNVKLSAEVLKKFGVKNSLTYSSTYDGTHFLDELLPIGFVNFARIKDGHVEKVISADIQDALQLSHDFELSDINEKQNEKENIVTSLKILHGDGTKSQVTTICVNAAIFLLLADKAESLEQGYRMAKEIMNTGKVWNLFLEVVELYGGNQTYLEDLVNNKKEL